MGNCRIPDAPAEVIEDARINCASRLMDGGETAEAEAFMAGERDGSWSMFHEIKKIMKEKANGGIG